MVQLTPNGFLDAICMIAVYLMAIYNYICMKNKKSGTNFFFFVMFITLFSLLYRPSDGDFWSYFTVYLAGADTSNRHLEEFYYWLMEIIPDNYLLWRLVIWFSAAFFIVLIYKIMKVRPENATTFFLALALLPSYYYTRNVLALSILYLAMAIVGRYNNVIKNAFNVVVFVGLVFASWFLHKSMPIYILLGFIAILLPFDKKYLIVALIAFPLIYGVIIALSSDFINFEDVWLMEESGASYLEAGIKSNANWKGVISLIIGYLPTVYFYIIAFWKPVPRDNSDFKIYKIFLLFSFFVFFVSFLFYGQGSSALQYRLYKSSMMPFTFVVSLYYKHKGETKEFKTFISLFLISLAFSAFTGFTGSL